MLALIDLDPLPYAYGSMTFDDGTPLADSILKKHIDEKLKDITEKAGCTDWKGYLTDSSSNFRIELATILPYKGNRRDLDKPAKYEMLKEYLLSEYPDKVELIHGMEADDKLSIEQYKDFYSRGYSWYLDGMDPEECFDTVICTPDKDLKMVPGWNYNWQRDEKVFISELEGLRFFYKQLLTGDMTDNIRGLYGVGKSSKLLKDIDELESEESMYLFVREQYVRRFGNYADQFLLETGRLLWMLRSEDDEWNPPTIQTT